MKTRAGFLALRGGGAAAIALALLCLAPICAWADDAQPETSGGAALSEEGLSPDDNAKASDMQGDQQDAPSQSTNQSQEDQTPTPGFQESDGTGIRYINADGSYAQSSWVTQDGKKYYIGADGYLAYGLVQIGGAYYFLDETTGAMRTGWVTRSDGSKSYFNSDGTMKTGWMTWSDGKKSYFGEDGRATTGWKTISNKKYYFDPSTAKSARWFTKIGSSYYYFNSACVMHTGWLTWKADGQRSYFASNGKALTGWQTLSGKRYYFNPSTTKAAKWLTKISGKYYYFNSQNVMHKGWLTWKADGRRSYFSSDGSAVTGWKTISGKKYYFNPSTTKAAKWLNKIGGKYYYFNSQGVMHTGWLRWKADGKYSYFNSSGIMLTGTQKIGGVTFNFGTSGKASVAANLNVPCLMQYPQLPTGCESVALTNALNYYGFKLSKTTMADRWIPRSSYNFVTAFWGNPHSASGNSIAAPGLTSAANKFLKAKGSSLRAYDVSGTSLTGLYSYLEQGRPVIVWCTIGQAGLGPCYGTQYYNGKAYRVYTNSHTVVLKGYDKRTGKVYLADSISGNVTCNASWFASIYKARGSQAVVIK